MSTKGTRADLCAARSDGCCHLDLSFLFPLSGEAGQSTNISKMMSRNALCTALPRTKPCISPSHVPACMFHALPFLHPHTTALLGQGCICADLPGNHCSKRVFTLTWLTLLFLVWKTISIYFFAARLGLMIYLSSLPMGNIPHSKRSTQVPGKVGQVCCHI